MAIPTRYREHLREICFGKLILTISLLHRCLVAYPFPEWQRIESELEGLPALDEKAQTIGHLLVGHAIECEMDGQGRILIPQPLREFARLDSRATMVGQIRKFEIWDYAAWKAIRNEWLEKMDELQEDPTEALRAIVL